MRRTLSCRLGVTGRVARWRRLGRVARRVDIEVRRSAVTAGAPSHGAARSRLRGRSSTWTQFKCKPAARFQPRQCVLPAPPPGSAPPTARACRSGTAPAVRTRGTLPAPPWRPAHAVRRAPRRCGDQHRPTGARAVDGAVALRTLDRGARPAEAPPATDERTLEQRVVEHLVAARAPVTATALRKLCQMRNATL